MDNDRLLINRAADKYRACTDEYSLTYTPFLDLNQQSVLEPWLKREKIINYIFFGGYPDAERRLLCFMPDYITEADSYFSVNYGDCPVAALRATIRSSDTLTHRDYLGALMGLGLKREIIGDIIVADGFADLIILRDSLPLVLRDLAKAGRAPLDCAELPLSELAPPAAATRELRDTIASPRLDAVIGVAFSLARGKAAEAIERGLVYVNNRLCEKTDASVSQGDRLTLRGMGRAYVKEMGGTSRSGRIFVTIIK